MRWRQVLNEETGKYEMVPRDERASRHDAGAAVHGDIQSFVSPVDGSVISDRRQLREHNKRNNVVNQAEFDGETMNKKRKEREDLHQGIRKPAQIRADRMEIYETITRLEREG